MKIGVMSDLHLGYRQYGLPERELDFYNQLYACVNEINKQKCDIVIIAGDIFDKPNPSPEAIHFYLDAISGLESDVILAITGNHTMLLRKNHYPVDKLVADESIDICGYELLEDSRWSSDTFALSGGDMQFAKWKNIKIDIDGITYRGPAKIDEFLSVQKELANKKAQKDSFRVLVLHQSFQEFCGFEGEELSIEDIDYSPYDVVICGHIHEGCDTMLNKKTHFLQPGSIERMNTKEARDEQLHGKGIYTIDTKTHDIVFHRVPNVRKFLLHTVTINTDEELEEHFKVLQETINDEELPPILSLRYNGKINQTKLWDEIRALDNYLINNSRVDTIDEDNVVIHFDDGEIPSVAEALNQYSENHFDEDEGQLFTELFHLLNTDSNGAKVLIDDFFDNNYQESESTSFTIPDEVLELFEYFENLEVK